jgi:hypothetical protein
MLKRGQLDVARFDSEEDDAYARAAAAALGKGSGDGGQPQPQQGNGHCAAPPSAGTDGPSRLALLRRALYLLYLFSAAIVTAALACISESFRSPYWYRMLACAISRAGAAFIKWGQWASARPDIFPVRLFVWLVGRMGWDGMGWDEKRKRV